jgi:hypothetical protein
LPVAFAPPPTILNIFPPHTAYSGYATSPILRSHPFFIFHISPNLTFHTVSLCCQFVLVLMLEYKISSFTVTLGYTYRKDVYPVCFIPGLRTEGSRRSNPEAGLISLQRFLNASSITILMRSETRQRLLSISFNKHGERQICGLANISTKLSGPSVLTNYQLYVLGKKDAWSLSRELRTKRVDVSSYRL